jgi:hypothetical protein
LRKESDWIGNKCVRKRRKTAPYAVEGEEKEFGLKKVCRLGVSRTQKGGGLYRKAPSRRYHSLIRGPPLSQKRGFKIPIHNSVVSLYYYVRVIKVMFFEDPQDQRQFDIATPLHSWIAAGLAGLTLYLGLFWNGLAQVTQASTGLHF